MCDGQECSPEVSSQFVLSGQGCIYGHHQNVVSPDVALTSSFRISSCWSTHALGMGRPYPGMEAFLPSLVSIGVEPGDLGHTLRGLFYKHQRPSFLAPFHLGDFVYRKGELPNGKRDVSPDLLGRAESTNGYGQSRYKSKKVYSTKPLFGCCLLQG